MTTDALSIQESLYPELTCFGCGHANPKGFHLRSYRDGELTVRAVTVARRADAYCRPLLDGHGRVTFRDRTVEVPMSQRAIVARLLECPGEVVSDREISALLGEVRASTHAEAVKTALRRIKDALEPLGLRLTRVRRAGYLLDRSP